jgi:hypothetical protein
MAGPPRAWTPEEDATLRAAMAEGRPMASMMRDLGRCKGSVHGRISVLGLVAPPPEAAPVAEVLALLEDLAARGASCPGDREISRAINRAVPQVQRALARLQVTGVITVAGQRLSRVVTIAATGAHTRTRRQCLDAAEGAGAVLALVGDLAARRLPWPGAATAAVTLGINTHRLRTLLGHLLVTGQLQNISRPGIPGFSLPDGTATAMPTIAHKLAPLRAARTRRAAAPAPKAEAQGRPARAFSVHRPAVAPVAQPPASALEEAVRLLRQRGHAVWAQRVSEHDVATTGLYVINGVAVPPADLLARAEHLQGRRMHG